MAAYVNDWLNVANNARADFLFNVTQLQADHEQKENCFFTVVLKVGGNEKNGGPGRRQMLGNGLGPWRSMLIYNLNMQFLRKISYFHFRL
jgi:hypothetical protein